jgi:hypothetical protein
MMTLAQRCMALVTNPRVAFDDIERKPRPVWPLVLLTLATTGALGWYYATVDSAWLTEQLMSANSRLADLSEAERERMARMMGGRTLLVGSMIGGAIAVPAMKLLEAVYYLLAGKVTGVQRSFEQWFGLAVWTSTPQLLGLIAGLMIMAISSETQVDPGVINPLSLNELFFHRALNEPGYKLWSAINLTQLWSIALAAIGIHHWSKRSWLYSVTMVLLPLSLYALVLTRA